MEELNKTCEICYKIKCKNCGWEPDDLEFLKISDRTLTSCPDCGWTP